MSRRVQALEHSEERHQGEREWFIEQEQQEEVQKCEDQGYKKDDLLTDGYLRNYVRVRKTLTSRGYVFGFGKIPSSVLY